MIVNANTHSSLRKDIRWRIFATMNKEAISLVGRNLEWLITKAKTNPNALQEATKVPQPTIHRILTGESRDPKTKTLQPLADYFGVTVADLRDRDFANEQSLPASAFAANQSKFKRIPVFGRAMGGFPERIWDEDGSYPVGFSDEYAEVASSDPHAFLVPIEGISMIPRFNPGEFALVEPGTEPEIEDDVLVRLGDGRTMIKKLLSRRGVVRLGSYNSDEVISSPPEHIVWMYYVAHPVPARKIKQRM